MRSNLRPRPNTFCAAYTSMTARFPPKALASPPAPMIPRTVNCFSPSIVRIGTLSPDSRPFRRANSRVTISESGWARKTSGSSTTASSPSSRS